MPESIVQLNYPDAWKLPCAIVKEWLDRKKDFILLDVREPFEREMAKIEPSVLIPMGELKARMKEIKEGKIIVAYCHHGVRSLRAVELLRANGYPQSFSLIGGIDEWAMSVDPLNVKRYVK